MKKPTKSRTVYRAPIDETFSPGSSSFPLRSTRQKRVPEVVVRRPRRPASGNERPTP